VKIVFTTIKPRSNLLARTYVRLENKPMIAPMPISQDAHQAPKIPAINAKTINQIAAAALFTHLEAPITKKPRMSIESPHQKSVKEYSGYQIKAKMFSIANPPTITRITPPIKAMAKPTLYVEPLVSDKHSSPPKNV
jgi:hypothetical protein